MTPLFSDIGDLEDDESLQDQFPSFQIPRPSPIESSTSHESDQPLNFSEKVATVLEVLDMVPPPPVIDSPLTKSATPKPVKQGSPAIPAGTSFIKAFNKYQSDLSDQGSKSQTGVKPPVLPRWYRPVETDWHPNELRLNDSWVHLSKNYSPQGFG